MGKYYYTKPKKLSSLGIIVAVLITVILVSLTILVVKSSKTIFRSNNSKGTEITIDREQNLREVFGHVTEEDVQQRRRAELENTLASTPLAKVIFIDVGQGDATLIISGEEIMLIDGGYQEQLGKIIGVLESEDIDHLDYVIATHAHADHVGGLITILEKYPVCHLLAPELTNENWFFTEMMEMAAINGSEIAVPAAGDIIPFGNGKMAFLGPIGPLDEVENVNNTSLVVQISFGDISFLLQGDAEWEEEQEIIDSGADISATVLKVGHHGSSSSTGYLWLRTIDPAYAVISCGTGNEYGHPTERTLSRLEDADVKLFRTDLQGTITCITDGSSLLFSVEKNEDIETFDFPGSRGE